MSGYSISSKASKSKTKSLTFKTSDFSGVKNLVYTQASTSPIAYAIGNGETGVVLASLDMTKSAISSIKPAVGEPQLPIQGVLKYIPVGAKGALIYFGGMNGEDKAPPDQVQIFDLSDRIWREQQTTGNDPSFSDGDIYCSAYAPAADGSSHSIYVFKNDGNVFILSLPSFIWFQIPPGSDSAPDYEPPRQSYNIMASCVVAPGSQQVVFFGVGSQTKSTCDNGKGAYVFDLNDLSWKDTYDDSLVGYEVPNQVILTIGGGPLGGATMGGPERGWSTTGLRDLFGGKGGTSDLTQSGGDGTKYENYAGVNTSAPNNRGNSNGVKIGGAVVAIVGAGALIATYLYIKHRRNQRGETITLRSIISPPTPMMPQRTQSRHTKSKFDFDDDYPHSNSRSSISKFGSMHDFSAESLNDRWSPDTSRSKLGKNAFSPVSSISRKPTDNTSIVSPETPYTDQFPRSPLSPRSIGQLQSPSDTISANPTSPLDYVSELPAHLPPKTYTQNRKTTFEELEGDYMFPIEKGDSDIQEISPVNSKKIGRMERTSQEMLLDGDATGVDRPESAVLPANVRSALGYVGSVRTKQGVDRRTTDSPSKARLERSESVQRRARGSQGDPPIDKAWSGKAKLVEMKRSPSQMKRGPSDSPVSPG